MRRNSIIEVRKWGGTFERNRRSIGPQWHVLRNPSTMLSSQACSRPARIVTRSSLWWIQDASSSSMAVRLFKYLPTLSHSSSEGLINAFIF